MMQPPDIVTKNVGLTDAWRAKSLIGYTVRAQDGETGKLHDFFFDQKSWRIYYIAVDLGNWVLDTGEWIPGQKVLVPAADFAYIFDEAQTLRVDLTKAQVETSPELEPEQALIPWDGLMIFPLNAARNQGLPVESQPVNSSPETGPPGANGFAQNSFKNSSHLHSLRKLIGLYIIAKDEAIGHVEDFLVEERNWTVQHLVVDTRNWLPGKKVLVNPKWLQEIDLPNSTIHMNLFRETILNSPIFEDGTL